MLDIDLRDVLTASFPTGEEFLALYKPFFRDKNLSRAAAGIIMSYKHPKVQDFIANAAILNQKGYNALQNGLGILNHELKFKGISTSEALVQLKIWQPILISVIAVFVLLTLIMNYSMKKTKTQNIIETIRNENI